MKTITKQFLKNGFISKSCADLLFLSDKLIGYSAKHRCTRVVSEFSPDETTDISSNIAHASMDYM